MAEFLVPHTFAAGTKAKAAEVNANFTACKAAIDANSSDIEDINNSLLNVVTKDGSTDLEQVQSYKVRTITGATNATPIVITSTSHGFSTGDSVYISGVEGNTAANAEWNITKVNDDSFSLNASTGNGAYTSGGNIYLLPSSNEDISSKIYVDQSNNIRMTDCILEAPNGVVTRNSNAITAKNGLRILIPDGLNSDGSFNNLEISLISDVSYTVTGFNDLISNIYLTGSGALWPIADKYCYYQEEEPSVFVSGFALWFKPSENKYYTTSNSGSDWNQALLSKIGLYETDTTSIIDFASLLPVRFGNEKNIKVLDHANAVTMSLSTTYTADRDGVLYGGCRNASPSQNATLSVVIDGIAYELSKTDSYGGGGYSFVEILKGQTYQFTLGGNFTPVKAHKFIPRKVV